jgi:hypothetical protein
LPNFRTLRPLALALTLAAPLAAAPAFAQTPAAPAATPMDKLTASQIAAGREVVILSGIYRTFSAFAPSIMQQFYNSVTPTRPEIRKDLEEVMKALAPEYEKRTEEMIQQTAKIFASIMNEADLKATAEFFKSKAGKAYVEMQPKVIDQMVVAVDEWNKKLAEEIVNRIREEMKKRGKDF